MHAPVGMVMVCDEDDIPTCGGTVGSFCWLYGHQTREAPHKTERKLHGGALRPMKLLMFTYVSLAIVRFGQL